MKAENMPVPFSRFWVKNVMLRMDICFQVLLTAGGLVAFTKPLKVGEIPLVNVTCHNGGPLPAINTQIWGRLRIDYDLTEEYLKKTPRSGALSSSLTLIPDGNAGSTIQLNGPLDQVHLDAIRNGVMAL